MWQFFRWYIGMAIVAKGGGLAVGIKLPSYLDARPNVFLEGKLPPLHLRESKTSQPTFRVNPTLAKRPVSRTKYGYCAHGIYQLAKKIIF